MGLTKQYLAYKLDTTFNIIASGRPNINFLVYNNIEGRYVVVGGAENALVWDLRLGEKVFSLKRDKQEVTAIRASPDRIHISVGYSDGVVEIFDIATGSSVCSLSLHKTAVTILRYDAMGIRLVSGGLDTELVVCDIVTQTGKQRLIGHSGPITDAHFFERFGVDDVVVSSSKDTHIKFWNLETQTCFKTIVDNRTEIWALAFVKDLMIAGTGESSMNIYRIKSRDTSATEVHSAVEGLSLDDEDTISPINVTNCGAIQKSGRGRTVNLIADPTERVISCHGTDDVIESFYICSQEEAKSRLAKRLKKSAKSGSEATDSSKELSLSDEIKRLSNIKVKNKIKSIDILMGINNELRIITNLNNNSLKMFSLNVMEKQSEAKLLRSITQSGHQSEVRTVCFSSDNLAIASGGGESMKLWNRDSTQCLRTVPTGYILSSCFVPGDRYVLLGLKSGVLLIVDIGTGEIVEEIPAHENELWSICLLPDMKGCVTGSSDTTVKSWSFELIDNTNTEDGVTRPKVLSLLHVNTLKLEETVLCVKVSPNMKFLAVGLLDSTVKIFFLDSFKFYLSLYGHKLPVLCMDISYDSTIIVTGSADRNIKLWGLDFGDCHRSLFAHDDSVMAVQFVPKTHMFFTCGKDGKIKQWDGDSFERIITLPGHVGEAYSLAVSPNGRYVVSCGSDRTLRMYERTDEPIVLQDVQEEEREEIENRTLATGEDNSVPILPGLKLPSRKTVGAEKGAESILECLEILREFESDEAPELHPLMIAFDAKTSDDFLLATLQRIRAFDMEEALVLLPFSSVCEILQRVPKLANYRKDQTEIICKVVLFLFRIHQKPITSNQTLLPVIGTIIKCLQQLTVECRDMVGMNYYGLQLLQHDIEEREGVELFRDATQSKKQRDKRRKFVAKRTHIQMV
ncbi:WD repeat-containing protein 3 [Episyrphus balteatus]|uniref:WD repeat-containing protein 3 n=1 Tax=Episyrphus balteatus TaxID=286459 RepID=UPI002485B9E6|nr:WD repeat-containing protein 3 [Episyrphus balteatus]